MRHHEKVWLPGLLAVTLLIGCHPNSEPTGKSPVSASEADSARYLLKDEPAGAKAVRAARQECKDGETVVVVGRIGGDPKPWIEGRAGFWIVDASLKTCEENQENCPTPWDYCHMGKDDLRQNMATVKIVDDQGRTVPVDARRLLGVKEMQTVVVKGQASRDEQGNLTVLGTGLYVRP
jgi:hypothetical protein